MSNLRHLDSEFYKLPFPEGEGRGWLNENVRGCVLLQACLNADKVLFQFLLKWIWETFISSSWSACNYFVCAAQSRPAGCFAQTSLVLLCCVLWQEILTLQYRKSSDVICHPNPCKLATDDAENSFRADFARVVMDVLWWYSFTYDFIHITEWFRFEIESKLNPHPATQPWAMSATSRPSLATPRDGDSNTSMWGTTSCLDWTTGLGVK